LVLGTGGRICPAHEALRVEWQLGPHRSEAQEALKKDGLSLEQRQSRGGL